MKGNLELNVIEFWAKVYDIHVNMALETSEKLDDIRKWKNIYSIERRIREEEANRIQKLYRHISKSH